MTAADAPLASGREALAAARWADARRAFERALAIEETPEAHEGLSWAAYWTDDVEVLLRARERAHALYRQRGDRAAAARMAMWLGSDHLDLRGEEAIAQGWYARAERLLEDLEPTREHGWLAFQTGGYAIELREDTATARQRGTEVARIARVLGDGELEMLGLALEGLALVTEGAVERGMRCLDEAAVAATGGEVSEHVASAWTLCYLIYACERARDFDRAAQWCRRMEELSARLASHLGLGVCRAHYASVLILRGEWDAAERELAQATADVDRANSLPAAAEADARLGELRRRQDRVAEASALFERSRPHPIAVVGSAALALQQGDAAAALDLLERHLDSIPEASRTQRADALELLVEVRIAVGDVAGAALAADALADIASAVSARPLHAAAAAAGARVEAARGTHRAAIGRFEVAIDAYERCGLPYEAARSRLALAASLDAVADPGGAARRTDEAETQLRRLGAMSHQRVGPLSPREVEVLRLVSDGLSDREIGERLRISPHTVHRHVSNILTKLGLSSRTAAAAQAARLGIT